MSTLTCEWCNCPRYYTSPLTMKLSWFDYAVVHFLFDPLIMVNLLYFYFALLCFALLYSTLLHSTLSALLYSTFLPSFLPAFLPSTQKHTSASNTIMPRRDTCACTRYSALISNKHGKGGKCSPKYTIVCSFLLEL